MRSVVYLSSGLLMVLSLLSLMACAEDASVEVPPAAWTVENPLGGDGGAQPPGGDAAQPGGDAAQPGGDAAQPEGDAAVVEPTECQQVCAQIQGCQPEGFDELGCLQSCERQPAEQRACVLASTCEALSACFEAPATGCQAACERLSGCGLGDIDVGGCVQGCEADDPARAECIIGSPCDAVQACFGGDPPSDHCPAACERFIGCGFNIFEMDECVEVCQGHDVWRATCMLDAGCEEISGCMSSAPAATEESCQLACERFIGCGFEIFEMEQCVGMCMGEDASRSACMIDAECDVIADCMRL